MVQDKLSSEQRCHLLEPETILWDWLFWPNYGTLVICLVLTHCVVSPGWFRSRWLVTVFCPCQCCTGRAHLIFFWCPTLKVRKAFQTTCVYIKWNSILIACSSVYIRQWWYYIALIVIHMMLHDIFSNHGYIILCLSACYMYSTVCYKRYHNMVNILRFYELLEHILNDWLSRPSIIAHGVFVCICVVAHLTPPGIGGSRGGGPGGPGPPLFF